MPDPQLNLDALRQVPVFRELRPADLAAILHVANLRSLKLRAILFRQGDPARSFFVIVRGRIKVGQLTHDGHEINVRFLNPGQMLGGPALFGNAPYPVTAAALEPAAVLCWTSAAISTLVSRYPQLARNMMLAMATRIVELQDRCRELATESVDRRLARALLRLAQQTGKPVDGGILLGLRLSRQSLAEMAGTTLFTASRTLSKWTRSGLVTAGREKVLIRRPHQLLRIADDLPLLPEKSSPLFAPEQRRPRKPR